MKELETYLANKRSGVVYAHGSSLFPVASPSSLLTYDSCQSLVIHLHSLNLILRHLTS